MSRMIEIRNEIVELKKQKMELKFTPSSNKPASYISDLRNIKKKLVSLITELANL